MQEAHTNPHHARRWLILFVIAIAQLMVVLDATVVNIALPSAQQALDFSNDQRQWVITAYALAFGSLLLLGGRIGDLFGRKRAFVIGLGGFAGASALGGFAQSFEVLVAARALQGVFGALLAPAALSVLTTTFTDPEERGKAFGIFGAVAVGGAAIGLILGGVLTEYLNWRWCLYVNLAFAVPAALAAMALLHNEVPEHAFADRRPRHAHRDVGAVRDRLRPRERRDAQLDRPRDVGMLVAGVVLLVAFVLIQTRSAQPAAAAARRARPRPRGVVPRDAVLAGAGMFGVFLFLTYYLQQNLGFSPIETGLAFLPMTVAIVIAATSGVDEAAAEDRPAAADRRRHAARRGRARDAHEHRRRHGVRDATSCPASSSSAPAWGSSSASAMATATFGVEPSDAGVASAMVNTMQQIGGSIGTALLSTLAASAVTSELAERGGPPGRGGRAQAAVHGYTVAFWWAAGIYAVGAVICAALLTRRSVEVAQANAGEPAFAHG